MEVVKHINYQGLNISVYYDDYASNPFVDSCQLGILYQNKRGSRELGSYLKMLKEFDDGKGNIDWKRLDRDYIWLRVYSYEHSSITLETSKVGNPFSCPWDSGLYGIIARKKSEIRQEYGWKIITPSRKNLVETYFENAIDEYSDYLNGNTYGYIVTDDDGEELDSCWGFYGNDHQKSGLIESATSFIEYYLKSKKAS